nr:hypothetical protein [Escherichia coli]
MLEQMVNEAVSHIPVPRDGRDYDPDVLQQAVNDAVANIPGPQDGRGVVPYTLLPLPRKSEEEAVRRMSSSA